MSARVLRPWTDLVKLHPDVEAVALTEAVLASLAGKAGYNRVLKLHPPSVEASSIPWRRLGSPRVSAFGGQRTARLS